MGWITKHAVHPASALHLNGQNAGSEVLPTGETRTSFNDLFDVSARINSDNAYWEALYPAGGTMLERLVGTTSAGGVITDNGMITEYEPGKWRIRNFTAFRAIQCTYQCKMAQVLLGAIGIPSVDLTTVAHDPMAYYDAEQGRWLYIDPTFGEMLTINGEDMSPLDLLYTSLDGVASNIVSDVLPGAEYLAERYFKPANVEIGMNFMAVYVDPQWLGGFKARRPNRFRGLGTQVSDQPQSTATELLPVLGCAFAGITSFGLTTEVRLASNWPGHVSYQRSYDLCANWTACSDVDFPFSSGGEVRYRSVDGDGFARTVATIQN